MGALEALAISPLPPVGSLCPMWHATQPLQTALFGSLCLDECDFPLQRAFVRNFPMTVPVFDPASIRSR